jgi:hypothetical protein
MIRGAEQIGRCAGLDDPAEVHDGNTISQVTNDGEVV